MDRALGLRAVDAGVARFGFFCAVLLLLGGCVSLPESKMAHGMPRFHLEAREDTLNDPRIVWAQLPVSETIIALSPVPAIPGFDIEAVAVEQTSEGPFLKFTLNSHGRMALMALTDANRGRRLVLVSGGKAMGAWRIDRISTHGELWIYPEIESTELNRWVDEVKQGLHAGVEY